MPLELTPLAAWIVLVVILLPLAWVSFVTDRREYRAFKAVSTAAERERYFRRWTLRGAAMVTIAPLAILGLFGRLGTVAVLPAEFITASERLVGPGAPLSIVAGADVQALVLGLVAAIVVSAPLIVLIQARAAGGKLPVVGDVEPLLPRNLREGTWGAALSINAGVGEEILFRLTLPLLLSVATGNVLLAFALSTILFGAVHAYQGVVGVVFVTVLGAIMGALYLASKQLWVPMVMHAMLDLRTLVLVPALGALLARGKPAAS
jgi:membrane protease YdiL (CAAX protease family)